MERLTGFEPVSGRWRRPILPLDDSLIGLGDRIRTCVGLLPRQVADRWPTPSLVDPPGIQPGPPACKAGVPRGNTSDPCMAERTGFEPVMCA